MELPSYFDHAVEQGAMFWAATGSVSLGLTLILAAGVGQIRRLRSRRALDTALPAGHDPAPEGAVEAGPEFPIVENPPIHPSEAELSALLTRLRRAAEQLETFRRQPAPGAAPQDESFLKPGPQAVEYVFRAGKG